MKAIDKTTEKQESQEQYHYGDILKCWYDDKKNFDLYQISNFAVNILEDNTYIAVLIHDSQGNMDKRWAGSYDSATDLVHHLKAGYTHVAKVKAHIVIDEVLSEGKDDEDD